MIESEIVLNFMTGVWSEGVHWPYLLPNWIKLV